LLIFDTVFSSIPLSQSDIRRRGMTQKLLDEQKSSLPSQFHDKTENSYKEIMTVDKRIVGKYHLRIKRS